MRRFLSTWKCWTRSFLLPASTLMGAEARTSDGSGSGTVSFAGMEMTEAQLLFVVFYGFLFVIMLRRRIVG